jgi:hypothetical protein
LDLQVAFYYSVASEWHVACMGEMRNAYEILARKPEGKR